MADSYPNIEFVDIDGLTPYASNARTHSKKQIRQIAASITEFGFTNPVLIGDDGGIIAGHGRVLAAQQLGMKQVPTLKLAHLSAEQRRAYILADNKLALEAGWDVDILAIEFSGLAEAGFDLSFTGFSAAEIDLTLDFARERAPAGPDAADLVPEPLGQAVSRMGDVWRLGRHRLACGDARSMADVDRLMAGEAAAMIFTDPPYNVAIEGNVSGLGTNRHKDFAMASGEMSRSEFTHFLTETLGNAARVCRDGAIAFVCMDWRHMREVEDAGGAVFTELKNLCVWNKTNAGMGTFYRSKHELIFVFKAGQGTHINNFGLGETGRHRTNVWDYAGVTSMSGQRAQELAMHPTVKPVALIADAMKDCSMRGDIVLDVFGGSGSTLIAAEVCGRSARVLEYDPIYCDTIARRWERYSGHKALREGDGATFADLAEAAGVAAPQTIHPSIVKGMKEKTRHKPLPARRRSGGEGAR